MHLLCCGGGLGRGCFFSEDDRRNYWRLPRRHEPAYRTSLLLVISRAICARHENPGKAKRMRLVFMRHSAVEFATPHCIGQTDVDLSIAGKSTLKSLAEEACRLLPDRVLSSDLKRCRLLAEQISGRLRIKPVFDPIWREIDFGFWENRAWDAIQRENPEAFSEWVADFV